MVENSEKHRTRAQRHYNNLTSEQKKNRFEHVKQWKRDHKESVALTARKSRYKKRDEVFALLGNKCARCGFLDTRALQIDHINGGGKRERRKLGQYGELLKIIKYLKETDENAEYQLLCANCNIIKRIENNEQYRKYGEKDGRKK